MMAALCAMSLIGVMGTLDACEPFTTGAAATSAVNDGGVGEGSEGDDAGVQLVPRDVRIIVDWPTVGTLDPRTDPRIREIRVNVGPTTSQTFAAGNSGPYAVAGALVPANGVVNVAIEIKGGDPPERLIGFGARRKFQLDADGNIPVAVRKRIVYVTSRDRSPNSGGELRALEGAPAGSQEPSMSEPSSYPALTTLREPSALWITSDGLQLVQGGQQNASVAGAIAMFATGSHARDPAYIPLQNVPIAISPLGEDGYEAVVAYEELNRTSFDLVDLRQRTVTPLSTGIVGGEFSFSSAAPSSLDGRAAIVFTHRSATTTEKPYLVTVHPKTRQATLVALDPHMAGVRAVRFSADGKSIIVAGYRDAASWSTGVLAIFDAADPTTPPTKTLTFAPGMSRPTSLLIFGDGKSAFVSNETSYGMPVCCNEPRIIDLESGAETWTGQITSNGPSHELLTGLRFPYAPFRVIGGQSDNGNNTNGAMVELKAPNVAPAHLTIDGGRDFGSIHGLASPFATQL